MRRSCSGNISALEAASAEVVRGLLKPQHTGGGQLGKANVGVAAGGTQAARRLKARRYLLSPACPLFGRKVAADAMGQWAEVLRPVMKPSW